MEVQSRAKRRIETSCERDGAGLAACADLLGLAAIERADGADEHVADLARGRRGGGCDAGARAPADGRVGDDAVDQPRRAICHAARPARRAEAAAPKGECDEVVPTPEIGRQASQCTRQMPRARRPQSRKVRSSLVTARGEGTVSAVGGDAGEERFEVAGDELVQGSALGSPRCTR